MVYQFNPAENKDQFVDDLIGQTSRGVLVGSLDNFLQQERHAITTSTVWRSSSAANKTTKDTTSRIDTTQPSIFGTDNGTDNASHKSATSQPTLSLSQTGALAHVWHSGSLQDYEAVNSQTENMLKVHHKKKARKQSKSTKAVTTASTGFNSSYGYGLVNAAAAVSQASGRSVAAEVPNKGGVNTGLDQVKAPEAWSQGYTGNGIVVAVVDSGVDYNHVDLSQNIWTNSKEIPGNGVDDDGDGYVDDVHGWDFVNNDSDPNDENGHGTHVAGTIAAANNGVGVTGVAYNAKIMPVRVLDSDGSGNTTDIAKGVVYAADRGANVINLSLGGHPSAELARSIVYATQKGAVVVMAAGNDGTSQPEAPADLASYAGVAVGSVDSSDKLTYFSDRAGSQALSYVVAPGVNIVSTTPHNTYAAETGTSMSTAYVSGVAALILSANPRLSVSQVTSILTHTASSTGLIA
jgi:subtilisin